MRTATIALGVALVLAVFSCTPPPRPPAATAPEANALARLYAEGKAAYQAGRYAEAAAKFAQVVEADPQHVNAWINWGVALSRGGAPQQALDKFRQALALDPDKAEAYYNWGVALERLGRHREAVEKYEQAIARRPALLTPALQRYLARHRPAAPDTTIAPAPGR